MGKAYAEEERRQIRTKLLEVGLELFHDQGVRRISIRELTKRAGIAQGSFYNFFPDKDALVIELIHYRAEQKMDIFEKAFNQSLQEPAAFVSNAIFRISWDLKQKAEQKQMYADILYLFLKEKPSEHEKLYAVFYSTLQKLTDYWKEHGLSVQVDIQGIMNVIKGTFILYANLNQFDQKYSESLLRTFIDYNCRKYIRETRKETYIDD